MPRQILNQSIDAREVPPILGRGTGGNPEALTPRSEVETIAAEKATSAITTHKQEVDPHSQYATDSEFLLHVNNTNNPHQVTAQQIGAESLGSEARAKTYTDQQILTVAQRITALEQINTANRLNLLESNYPTSAAHVWGIGKITSGKTWTYNPNSAFLFGRTAYVTNAANNETVEFDLLLKAGTYSLQIIGSKNTDRGIGDFYINNTFIGTIDFYASSYSTFDTSLPFSINSSGLHTFKVVHRKNASSAGYVLAFSALLVTPVVATPVNTVLINCGDTQPYTATDGRVWSADNSFVGGTAWNIEATTGETFTVANTTNQRIYKFERSVDTGSFYYSINLGLPGTFTLKLLFSESVKTAIGQRVGSVKLDGQNLLTNFDIFKEAPGRRRALVQAWTGLQLGSSVRLDFTTLLINGIEITRSVGNA